jgi:hypothetical protein
MSTASKRYLSRVAALGCVVCRRMGYSDTPAEIHHPRFAAGMAQRASDWIALPVCPEHHRGPRGIHGDQSALRQIKVDEPQLLADVIQLLNT